MDNIIQQLKDNEKPFGLMSEAMQAKQSAMRHEDFQVFRGGEWMDYDTCFPGCNSFAYRLRANYEDEPKIVEIRIYNEGNERYFEDEGEPCQISTAINSKDFIGFRYENGMVRPDTIAYLPGDNYEGIHHRTEIKGLVSGEITVLHATHVLMRRKKQE